MVVVVGGEGKWAPPASLYRGIHGKSLLNVWLNGWVASHLM